MIFSILSPNAEQLINDTQKIHKKVDKAESSKRIDTIPTEFKIELAYNLLQIAAFTTISTLLSTNKNLSILSGLFEAFVTSAELVKFRLIDKEEYSKNLVSVSQTAFSLYRLLTFIGYTWVLLSNYQKGCN